MYAVSKEGVFVGYADSVVNIRLHKNGSYVPCADDEADGCCAKMAVSMKDEDGNEYHSLSDTVFCLAGHELRGTEPVGSYEEMGAAIPLTEAESAVGAVVALTGEVVTMARAVELRPVIEQASASLSDGEAAKSPELFPKWAYPVSYVVGNRVSDGGKLYKCRKAHTSQERWNPAATPDLWVVIDVAHAGL